jgi:uncharacterized membrane protein YfcA
MWSEISWRIPLFMGLSAVLIGNLAGKVSARTKPALLRKSFAYLLFAIAGFTILQTWFI